MTTPAARPSAVIVSPAVKRALAVLAEHGQAHDSNATSVAGSNDRPRIYWQSRAWLSARGYVRPVGGAAHALYALTDDGWALVGRLKLAGEQGRML